MCSCNNKGIKASQAPIINGHFSARSATVRFSGNDFVTKYYIGETLDYIGSATNIDYGIRTYNSKTMVNVLDLQADSHLFSDTPVEIVSDVPVEVPNDEPEERGVHLTDVVLPENSNKRKKFRAKVEENDENNV